MDKTDISITTNIIAQIISLFLKEHENDVPMRHSFYFDNLSAFSERLAFFLNYNTRKYISFSHYIYLKISTSCMYSLMIKEY